MSIEYALGLIIGTTGIVTTIFHTGLYIGKLVNRIERHSDTLKIHGERLDNHATHLDEHDDEMRFLKGLRK